MPDTLTIRTSDEAQARFKSFAESGDFKNQSEFLNHLLALHAAQETGIRVPTLEGAVTVVSELTDRVMKIIAGAGETIIMNQEKEKARIESIQEDADKKTASLVSENERLKTELEEQTQKAERMETELAESREHEKKLEQMLDDKSALIDEYREKIDSLGTEIHRQKSLITEATDTMNEVETLRQKTKEQDLQIERLTLEKDKALNDQKALFTKKMNETVTAYDAAIAQKEIDIGQIKNSNDKALIALETKLRKEMNDQQAEYGKSISGYESKVFSLLQEIENSKTPKAQK